MISRSLKFKLQRGFTLIEIAIVLLIVSILLGYAVAMFPKQQELKQYRHVEREMDMILEELVAYAQVNGRLPCPDTVADSGLPANAAYDGAEDINPAGTGCEAYFGFLPARTLGINGKYTANGTLADPWGSGYGYAVSNADFTGDGVIDLVNGDGIRDEGIENVAPDLVVCDDSAALGFDLTCVDAASNQVVGNVAAVIVSLGKDATLPASSNIQAENTDSFDNGVTDKVYIFSARRDDYDDVVKWLSTNLLFSKMIEADRLP